MRPMLGMPVLCAVILAIGCETKTIESPPRAELDYELDAAISMPKDSAAFFHGTSYSSEISTPEKILGRPVGVGLASHEQILDCFAEWAAESPRAELKTYAKTHEGRALIRVIITSEENLQRLDEIKKDIGRLADPRGLDEQEAKRIVDGAPAVAWLGYSIHGNELSGADASLAVGYHLIAGTSADVTELLEKLVIVIDPVMNPDGRERTISSIDQSAGHVTNLDYASMHRGRWPWGRGNHYLFDMNRDWIVGIAPETRGRWRELLELHPQLVVDVHEMGPLDTYLFYPASEPHNPNRPPNVLKWQKVFADKHAAAFDARGWSYYTREWVDGWYPGYSDAWSSLNGAVGMLYEQARLLGQSLKRPSGRVVTYDEPVRAQAVSSLSDLETLAEHRREILSDFLTVRRLAVETKSPQTFALRTGRAPDRERAFLKTLLRQGIEVYKTTEELSATKARGPLGVSAERERFPVGTYLVPDGQPQGMLVKTLLDLDPRFSEQVLLEERQELERKNKSKIYDVTAWDLVHAFDLDGFWIAPPRVAMNAVTQVSPPELGIVAPSQGEAYAWIVDGREDTSVAFAAAAIELGVNVHVAKERFSTAKRVFPRGSLLIRRQENDPGIEKKVEEAAKRAGVRVIATSTGRSQDEGPDLGGREFELLFRPRVAVLANWPVWPSEYGHVWHQLDTEIQVPFTLLDLHLLDHYDLRRYNVIVVPNAHKTIGALLKPRAKALSSWVRAGGTLIAIGSSAAAIAKEGIGLGTVRLRRDVLMDLDGFAEMAERDLAAREIEVDPAVIWGETTRPAAGKPAEGKEKEKKEKTTPKKNGGGEKAQQAAERRDKWKRRFSPHGAILRGLVNLDNWLTFGCREELPVLFDGDFAFMARDPARAPVRLGPAADLRLAGLLWPEAVERLALTAYVTVERLGAGQVILFASSPSFRAYFKGTARLLANAVVYGPSLGASQPHVW